MYYNMISALLIDKTGTIAPIRLKEVNESDLYKKCGFKNNRDFDLRHTWKKNINNMNIYVSLYAKNKSKTANFENKYEFPPPVDKELYFGTCLLLSYTLSSKTDSSDKTYISITADTWKSIYTSLYGGFESLSDTEVADEHESDELALVDKSLLTKTGYLKDGFVVDDDYVEDTSSDIESDTSSDGRGIDTEESIISAIAPHPVKYTSRKPKYSGVRNPTYIVRNIQMDTTPASTEELKVEDFV